MPEEPEQKLEQPDLELIRTEDFENLYANNVRFESTLWDLRLILGQVDLAAKQLTQHTAVNIPWPQVKIAAYYMLINLVIQQALNGNVFIPNNVMPHRPDPSDASASLYPSGTVEYLGWIHDQIFGSDQYVPPVVKACLEREEKPKA